MKKAILSLLAMLSVAQADCFFAKEGDTILKQEGACDVRYSPCSTFKIPLALMGVEEGFIRDEVTPLLPYQKIYQQWNGFKFAPWEHDHNPTSWMKNSVVWYSQVMTKQLGFETLTSYVAKFDYGNQDLSGDLGQNNGLTHSWLSSSLKISAIEQVIFLEKLVEFALSVSPKAHQITQKLLFVETLPSGWHLYGKTGSGRKLDASGKSTDLQEGWFVGWVEKEGRRIIFALHLEDEKPESVNAGMRSRKMIYDKIDQLFAS